MPDLFSPPLEYQEIAKYFQEIEFLEKLRAGGQGVVFKVRLKNNITGALKIYFPNSNKVRIVREVEKLREINSEYIVRLLSEGTLLARGEECLYSIVEFIDGTDLFPLIGKLQNNDIHILLHDISHAIEVLWENRIVHRDITLGNVLRKESGRYTVIDLGLAKYTDKSAITSLGKTCGTPGYMSPEQSEGRRYITYRSDLFSLGLIAYEVASGQHPFKRRQELIRSSRPVHLSDLCALDKNTCDLIHRLLEPHPLKRPHQCKDVYSKAKV